VLERASSQSHNLKVGLRRVCFAIKFCDKSRDADDAATMRPEPFSELEANLTERYHGLMSAISEP
jgi:hypothetical protein